MNAAVYDMAKLHQTYNTFIQCDMAKLHQTYNTFIQCFTFSLLFEELSLSGTDVHSFLPVPNSYCLQLHFSSTHINDKEPVYIFFTEKSKSSFGTSHL
jgi:hypothetical protein